MKNRPNPYREIVPWLVAGLLSALALAWVFPRLYPLFPRDWEISQAEAREIALEKVRDLGDLPVDPYVVLTLDNSPVREHRIRPLVDSDPALLDSDLARRILAWEVKIFDRSARSGDWTYLVVITGSGEVSQLQLRVPPDEGEGVLREDEGRSRSDAFLRQEGFDLNRFEEPEARTRELQDRTDLFLRYRDRQRFEGVDGDYGIEVSFAGDQLTGYSSYFDDPDKDAIQDTFQPLVLMNQAWIFISLLILPIVGIPFVRRYHAGEIGVQRGLEVAVVVIVASAITMLFCARAAASGWIFGILTRPQVTAVVSFQMMVLFFFPMALVAFLSWSVGESLCREQASDKLAAFDAFFKRDWLNATFAKASLRGFVGGLSVLAVVWLVVLGLRPLGVYPSMAAMIGPWWESSPWFSVPMLAFAFAYALYAGIFGHLLLISAAVGALGKWVGSAVATLGLAVLFFPVVVVLPLKWALVLWIMASAAYVALFLLYGIFTSVLAYLTTSVLVGAIPFLHTTDPFMQAQAAVAVLVVALPMLVSLRYLLSDREFVYRYEDIPPHVRRIADRERQRVELETARGIQSSILPDLPPQLNGVELAHSYLPATEVGGDFYDVMALEDGRLAVAVGDVAGHGVSSGLVMSMAKAALAVQVTFDPDVQAVFDTLNRLVFQSARKRLLTTLCYALVDPQKMEMFYASAGHLFPYRVTPAGEVYPLESVSYPLGVRDDLEVRVRAANLAAGDHLFLFSDGVVEARPEQSDEMFGFERLEASLARHSGGSAIHLRDGVLDDLAAFTGSSPRDDDLTVLVLGLPDSRHSRASA